MTALCVRPQCNPPHASTPQSAMRLFRLKRRIVGRYSVHGSTTRSGICQLAYWMPLFRPQRWQLRAFYGKHAIELEGTNTLQYCCSFCLQSCAHSAIKQVDAALQHVCTALCAVAKFSMPGLQFKRLLKPHLSYKRSLCARNTYTLPSAAESIINDLEQLECR